MNVTGTDETLGNGAARWLRGIGKGLLWLVVGILMLLSMALTGVAPFVTAVPLWTAIILWIADLALWVVLLGPADTLGQQLLAATGVIAVGAVAVILSQWLAYTPPILDENGEPVPGHIATMEQVELNGSRQWISIRGYDRDNPVLLILSGGPGGSELASPRLHLPELEEHFIVVGWDQPGAAKSYGAVPMRTLTPERYVQDGVALVEHLRARFDEEKVYLLGESWGSILGTWMVRDHPELFHAFIGTGQMVNTTENDQIGYAMAIDYLTERGELERVAGLEEMGPPPYVGGNETMTYARFLSVLNNKMARDIAGRDEDHDILIDALRSPEYGLWDKFTWVLGLMRAFNQVYPRLQDLDLRTQAADLAVPVYFWLGRYDYNAVTSLAESYYEVLEAPYKEIVWFEYSGHPPLYGEPDKTVDLLVNDVLARWGQ